VLKVSTKVRLKSFSLSTILSSDLTLYPGASLLWVDFLWHLVLVKHFLSENFVSRKKWKFRWDRNVPGMHNIWKIEHGLIRKIAIRLVYTCRLKRQVWIGWAELVWTRIKLNVNLKYLNCLPLIFLKLSGLKDSGMEVYPSLNFTEQKSNKKIRIMGCTLKMAVNIANFFKSEPTFLVLWGFIDGFKLPYFEKGNRSMHTMF